MRRRGFTLIELLIVIALIAILAALAYVSFARALQNSRDSKRKNDLHELQTAIEVYYTDHGSYPDTGGAWRGACAGFGNYDRDGSNGYVPDVAPKYLKELPVDPRPAAHPNLDASCTSPDVSCFLYRSDGEDYKLISNCGIETSPPQEGKVLYDPVRPGYSIKFCSKSVTACDTW